MTDEQIKYMVDRFLGWELPRTFSPDGGIRYVAHWPAKMPMPSGTNLFDATQADAMVRYMIEGMPRGRLTVDHPAAKAALKEDMPLA